MKWMLLLAATVVSFASHARPLSTGQKLSDFYQFVSILQGSYGPWEYKKQKGIVDVDRVVSDYVAKIQATKDNREFYYTMVQFVAEFKDGHFSISIPTDHAVSVPIFTDLVNGKVLITSIDRSKVNEQTFPFAVGDEIIEIDGEKTADYLTRMQTYIGSGMEASRRRIASWTVFSRRAYRFPITDAKTIKVRIRRGQSSVIEAAELTWTVNGTPLDEAVAPQVPAPPSLIRSGVNYDLLMHPWLSDQMNSPESDRGFACSGTTRIKIPDDATVIMREPFVAYYYPTSKGNVGYLRIPHYYPKAPNGESTVEATFAWISQYEYAISKLEANTIGLVIDQDHNCGGSVWVVNKMISMFMDKPFEVSKFELLATKESYLDFKKWFDEEVPNTIAKESVEKVYKLIGETWRNGTSRLTPPIAIDGENEVSPNGIRYSKPVVILIDEVAGSGGDMFPAMMKGLGRAKLFGQNTSGLGGHIQTYDQGLSHSAMTYSLTKSLFYRPDGVAVENNGAVPDRFYTITRDDVMYGFQSYKAAYEQYLFEQLK